ncbi:MAG: hypothetical protein U0176_17140 [Bacteroidia bacterium]
MKHLDHLPRVLAVTLLYATMLLGTAQAQGSGQAAASNDEPSQQLQSSTAPAAVPVFSTIVLPDQPKIITGQYGTRALIPANAFVFPDGTPVTSPVTVEVREVANKRGMILENLPTISNGRLLESGGVVKVTATSAGRESGWRMANRSTSNFQAATWKE